jgi:ribosome-binding protein aMBF1 (putative translation factor)
MDGQDWDPLTITSKQGVAKAKAVANAVRKVSASVAQARKVEAADGPVKQKVLDPASRQAIVAYRVAQQKSQTEFNQMCQFPANTIREIEAGRLTPSIGQLNTLNRIMKMGLKLI